MIGPWVLVALALGCRPGDEPAPGGTTPPGDGGGTTATTDGGTGGGTDGGTDGGTEDPCAEVGTLVADPAVADQAAAAEAGSIAALLATVPDGCEVVVHLEAAGAYPVGGALELPAWTTLQVDEGAWLELDATARVTVDGGLLAGPWLVFGGEGAVDGAPAIDAALPEWFGAQAGDDLDDHVALQRAADFFAAVLLQAGTYDLAGTVTLGDGASLAGLTSDATLRSALVYPESGGFHPTRLLQADGASELRLSDLVIDGNRHAHLVECWDYPETDNLLRFVDIDGLSLERVQLTGWEANWGTEDQSLAHALAVVDSREVLLVDLSLVDSRTEGILVQDSEDVVVERLSTRNVDVWTPLNVVHVEGFSLLDSTIVEDEGIEWTGSTVNLAVRQAVVSGNSFVGGWGLDFGDEAGTVAWGPGDITIEHNEIETVGQGIYFSPYAEGDRVSEVWIHDNQLRMQRGDSSGDTNEMIRIDAAASVIIEGNSLEVLDGGEALVRGLSFAGSTEDILVQDNVMIGVDVGISHSGDSEDGGSLSIVGNDIACADRVRLDSWSGGSTGVWIFRYVAAHFDEIVVEDNDIDAVGGWVSLIDYASLYSDPPPFVDRLVVVDNRFSPEGGSERGVASDGASEVEISGNSPDWVNP